MIFNKIFVVSMVLCLGLGPGVAHAVEMGPVDIHGYISQGYLKSSANDFLVKSANGSSEFDEVGLNFSTNVNDKLRLALQLSARNLGSTGQNQVYLDWGFADYNLQNELSLRLGRIKMPHGLYNEIRDTDMLRTWVLLPQSVYSESYRQFKEASDGGSIYGTINASSMGSLEYQAVAGSLTLRNDDLTNPIYEKGCMPFALLGETITGDEVHASSRIFYTGQLLWNTPLEGFRLSVTGMDGKNDLTVPVKNEVRYTRSGTLVMLSFPERSIGVDILDLVFSGEYKWNGLTLAAEYELLKFKLNYHEPDLGSAFEGWYTLSDQENYYASIAYRFTDWLELGSYYGVHYFDKDDKDGDVFAALGLPNYVAWQKDTCFTARFDINPAWCFKLEDHLMNGAARVYNLSDAKKHWSLYGAKVSFNF
jgi:hypothetical protein